MRKELIEVGQIVNTHGVRGECKLHPLGFTPEFISKFKTLYIDGIARETSARRVHGTELLVSFPDVTDMNEALRLKGKFVSIRRSDAKLRKNEFFDEELLGLEVVDYPFKRYVGELNEVLTYPAHKVYQVVNKEKRKTYLIPAVQDIFIAEIDMDDNRMVVKMMEGLAVDED